MRKQYCRRGSGANPAPDRARVGTVCVLELLENRTLLAFTAMVNFQPPGALTPVGYLPDTGSVYADRGNGHSYGWSVENNNAVDRNASHPLAQRYATFNQMTDGGGTEAGSTWEIAVAAGVYNVRIAAGDPAAAHSGYGITAQGVLTVSQVPGIPQNWVEGKSTVVVTDGRLTITGAPGSSDNKINFVHIADAAPTQMVSALRPGSGVELSWTDNAYAEAGYVIERSEDGVDYETIGNLAADQTQYLDQNVEQSMTYHYRLGLVTVALTFGYLVAPVVTNVLGGPVIDGVNSADDGQNQQQTNPASALVPAARLAKRHYIWTNGGNRPDPALIAATGSFTLRVENATPQLVAKAVAACRAQNAVLALAASPYHPRAGEGNHARRWAGNDPTVGGARYAGELEFFAARLALIAKWVDGRVPVEASLLDTECFWTTADETHNAAVAEKHEAMAALFRKAFPDATILWFDFGGTVPLADRTLKLSRRHDLSAERAVFTPILYAPADLEVTRAQLEAAPRLSVPWVAIGASQEWTEGGDSEPKYNPIARYPTKNSYEIGRMLAAADVPAVVLYPEPGAAAGGWHAHFAAYRRGWASHKPQP